MLIAFTGCTSDEEPVNPVPKEQSPSKINIILSANKDDIQAAAQGLDSLESREIHLKCRLEGAFSPSSLTRTQGVLSFTGNIKKRGRIKTLFNYGEGQNLVPAGLCGAYSISDWYEVSGNVEFSFPGATYENTVGEYSGWSGRNIGNPQTPYQFNRGTEDAPEYVTFIYDIRSGADGTTPPGGHLWVPFNDNEVKLYCIMTLP